MLRRTLLKLFGLAPAVAVIPPENKDLRITKIEDIKGELLITDGVPEGHPILNMTVGEFADAKTVRITPEELAKWDKFFKTRPIINKKMERLEDEEELKRQDAINEACKNYCHKCCGE